MMEPAASHLRSPAFFYLLAVLLAVSHHAAAQDPTVSIASFTAYDVQRACVKDCLIGPHPDGNRGVINGLGCTFFPMLDSCYCRTAMVSEVSRDMTECINSWCGSKTADLSAALSLYDHYCAQDLTVITNAATVSLTSEKAWSAQRACVQGCMLSRPDDGGTNLLRALQCTATPAYNDCMCRPDLSADANKHLTTCVNKWCSGNTAEIASAVSLYSSYCAAASNPAATDGGDSGGGTDQTSAIPGGSTSKGQPTQTGTVVGTNRSGSPSSTGTGNAGSSNAGGGISTGTAAGIAVAVIVIGLGGGAAVWIFIRKRKHPSGAISLHNRPSEELKPVYPPRVMPHSLSPHSPQTVPRDGSAGFVGQPVHGAPNAVSEQNMMVHAWRTRSANAGTPTEYDVQSGITDRMSMGRF